MVLDTAADAALSLKDKIVVVTGGGSGISLSYVKIAYELGSKIIIGDLKLTHEGEEFVKEADPKRVVSSYHYVPSLLDRCTQEETSCECR
jgi:NAD(P)-dependent dehydrogenase (short-subunit alcohol dehydrogenase family)